MTQHVRLSGAAGMLDAWAKGAKPGEWMIYHRGFLMADRADWPVDQIAKAAWRNYEADLVLLVQQRVCEMVYDYIAVKQRLPQAARHLRGISSG